jgi:hypothetical protein
MANTTVGASVEIEYKSIGDLRKAIKEATNDLIILQEKFGVTSREAMMAANKVAGLKDRIKDAREQTDRFDPGKKFQGLVSATKIIATGFSAVTSGMALLGVESNKLQETMLKVQAAMAFSQAISQLGDLQEDFDNVKVTAKRAFDAIKSAIGSTGIGLLVVAIGAIAANWDRIKGAISGVSVEQRKLNEQTNKNLEAQKKKLEAIDLQENTLRLQGKSEKEILALKIKQTNDTIIAAQASVKNARITRDSQIAAAKRNRDILAGVINFLSLPLTMILKTVGKIGEFLGKDWTFDLGQTLASTIFDPEEVGKQGDAALEQAENNLAQLISKRDGFQIQLNNIDKKANDKAVSGNKEKNDKINSDDDSAKKAALEAQKRSEEELAKSRMSARNKELTDLQNKYAEQKAIIEKGGADTTALTELYRVQEAQLNKKYDDLEAEEERKKQLKILELTKAGQEEIVKSEEDIALESLRETQRKRREEYVKEFGDTKALRLSLAYTEATEEQKIRDEFRQKQIKKDAEDLVKKFNSDQLSFAERLKAVADREKLVSDIIFKNEDERTAFVKANSDARIKIQKDEKNAVIQALDAVAQSLLNSSELLGKNTGIGKTLAIASATISMFTSAQKAYEATVGIPFVGPVLAPINAGLAIAAGIKNIREISKVKVPGNGGGGVPNPPTPPPGNAPLQPMLSPAVQGQALNATAINNLGNQSLRAYVMNSDIQNNNQRNAYLQRNARIG